MSKTIADWIKRLVPEFDSEPESNSDSPEATPSDVPQQSTSSNVFEDIFQGKKPLLLSVARSAMACEFEVLQNQHQYPQGTEAAMTALALIEQLEERLSVYKPRSDLSQLNRFGATNPQPMSFDAFEMLELAKAAFEWTEGAFDLTAGTLSEVWGFSRREGKMPAEAAINAALEKVSTKHVALDAEDQTAELGKAGVCVNPGGVGKGYALDKAAGSLVSDGIRDFMIHGGLSSIVARGDRQNATGLLDVPESGWQVSLKHPWRWEEHLGTIWLHDRALGTSGSGKQFFHFGGKRYSHIIDPRTGWPAEGMMSTTVISPSAAISDMLATAFFVMGLDDACAFCEEHSELSAILIYQDAKSGRQKMEARNLSADVWQPR